ncbi:MAG: L-histidine N(alpha)-methyltransferase, partial [Chryseobacterium sp.]
EFTIEDRVFNFEEHELIDMEISQKFSEKDITEMAENAGFTLKTEIRDSKNWFVDSIWQA